MLRQRRPGLILLAALLLVLAGLPALIPRMALAQGTADLAVTMVGDAKRLKFGDTITFTVTVTNLGPDTATGITLGFGTSDSYHNFGGTCPDDSVSTICLIDTLAPGKSVTASFRARAANACCPEKLGVATGSVSSETEDLELANNAVRIETKFIGKPLF